MKTSEKMKDKQNWKRISSTTEVFELSPIAHYEIKRASNTMYNIFVVTNKDDTEYFDKEELNDNPVTHEEAIDIAILDYKSNLLRYIAQMSAALLSLVVQGEIIVLNKIYYS